jgi:integrase
VSDSTRKPPSRPRKLARPQKPYDGFPLSPHASGKWQKKIRGTIHYFGRWAHVVDGVLTRVENDGWQEALDEYKEQAEDLHAGRTPRVRGGELTVGGLCNKFLEAKRQQYEAGELSARMFKPGPTPETATGEYKQTTDVIVAQFGGKRLVDDLAAEDFAALRATLAKRLGPVRLGNEVQKVRTVFKFGYEAGLIDKPMRFGPQFVKPSRSVMRRHRAKGGEKLFTAEEVRKLIDKAGVPLKAMILLGVNAGFGGADCGSLPLSAIDLEGGWVTFPRPKTGIGRRAALWPETVTALREAIERRWTGSDSSTRPCFSGQGRPSWIVGSRLAMRSPVISTNTARIRLGLKGQPIFPVTGSTECMHSRASTTG